MTKKAIICVGAPASGKSTFAKTLQGWVELNFDDIRREILGFGDTDRLWRNRKQTHSKDSEVKEIWNQKYLKAIEEGSNIVCSDCNLKVSRRQHLEKELIRHGYVVEIKVFGHDIEGFQQLLIRDQSRADPVGAMGLGPMWSAYASQYRRKIQDTSLPKVVLCDLDGTLFHMEGLRGPFEWDKVGLDLPDHDVYTAAAAVAKKHSAKIIFMSGRDDICRELTQRALDENNFDGFALYMRPHKDQRSDVSVKLEMLEKHIFNKYHVVAVFDDRPVVCDMYHDLGFKVFSMGDQRVRF